MSPLPSQLRARAARLEAAARSLDGSLVHRLALRADDDTWRGPTARRCHAELLVARAHVVMASADLHHQARALRRRAESLEALAPVA